MPNQLFSEHQIRNFREIGTPGPTRTGGLLLRRQLLYPTELQAHIENSEL